MARHGTGHPILERGFLIAFAVVFVLIAALFPLAQQLDERVDSQRPMYDDVLEMAVLQFRAVRDAGEPEPVTVAPGETVQVGEESFTADDGVSVEVRLDGVGYCVRARNDAGDQTGWQCYDGSEDPSPRGFSF